MNDEDRHNEAEQDTDTRPNRAQWTVAVFIATFTVAVVAYKLLHYKELEQTAMLYIGLPAALAIGIALAPRAKSLVGMTFKGITIAVLLSAFVVGEGFICVLMASPLFYIIGLGVAQTIQAIVNRADKKNKGKRLSVFVGLPILLMSLEGTTPATTFSDDDTSHASTTVDASSAEVREALQQPITFDESKLPTYLSLGFPNPVLATGGGLRPGDTRTITFRGAAPRPALLPQHHWGTHHTQMMMKVASSDEQSVIFDIIEDNTPMASWLQWKTAKVEWHEMGDGTTKVRWQLDYKRRLAPAWYFGPWERYGAGEAAEYLLSSLDLQR